MIKSTHKRPQTAPTIIIIEISLARSVWNFAHKAKSITGRLVNVANSLGSVYDGGAYPNIERARRNRGNAPPPTPAERVFTRGNAAPACCRDDRRHAIVTSYWCTRDAWNHRRGIIVLPEGWLHCGRLSDEFVLLITSRVFFLGGVFLSEDHCPK